MAPPATNKQLRSAASAPRRQTVLRALKEGETARPTQQARSNLDRFYTGFWTVPATFSTPLVLPCAGRSRGEPLTLLTEPAPKAGWRAGLSPPWAHHHNLGLLYWRAKT